MRKLLALLLTLAMTLSLLSVGVVSAVAVEVTEAPAGATAIDNDFDWATLEEGETYKLTEDIVLAYADVMTVSGETITSNPIVIPNGVTIYGEGHTITVAGDTPTAHLFKFAAGSTAFDMYDVTFGASTTDPLVISRESTTAGTANLGVFVSNSDSTGLVANYNNVDMFVKFEATGGCNVGGFMHSLYATQNFKNCDVYINADLGTTASQGGAFAAQTVNATTPVISFDNCTTVAGSIISKNTYCAGFISQFTGTLTMKNCINNATVIGTNGGAACNGGFIATMAINTEAVTIENCINLGDISNSGASGSDANQQGVGGIVGNIYDDTHNITIRNCANYGNVEGRLDVGGLCGRIRHGELTIENFVNYGSVTSRGQFAAGVVARDNSVGGKTLTISNAVNHGNVSGSHGVAGMVANTVIPVTLNNCLNTGDISANSNGEGIGGMIGRINSVALEINLTNCVNVGTITGSTKANTNYGAFTEQFGQFIGRVFVGIGNDPWTTDGTSADGIAWIDKQTGTTVDPETEEEIPVGGQPVASLINLDNCYGFGVAQPGDTEVAESEYKLTGFTKSSGVYVYTYTESDALPEAPNGGAFGSNVKAAEGSTYTMLTDAAANAKALNDLKLFPVTFKADNGAVVVDEAPAVKGYQTIENAEGKITAIRFAATLNDLDAYASVGFSYVVNANGGDAELDNTKTTTNVLRSVNEKQADGSVTKQLAAVNGGKYFYTLTINNIPTTGTVEFEIEAFATPVGDGAENVSAGTVTVTITDGVVTHVNGNPVQA